MAEGHVLDHACRQRGLSVSAGTDVYSLLAQDSYNEHRLHQIVTVAGFDFKGLHSALPYARVCPRAFNAATSSLDTGAPVTASLAPRAQKRQPLRSGYALLS